MESFLSGTGDVLLDYEDDAIASQRKGASIDYVVPPQTILIQNPIAVLSNSTHKAAAQAFVNYLLSEAGQELWAKEGYRPVIASAAQAAGVTLPDPERPFHHRLARRMDQGRQVVLRSADRHRRQDRDEPRGEHLERLSSQPPA